MISAAMERCAGIDVGKKFLAVCVMVGPLPGEPQVEIRKFGTIRAELEALRAWLKQQGITHVVMESTGSYWKPVFNVLEDAMKVYLANPQEVKNRKGHKTDNKDGWWLAHLLRHAMIHPSFIPPRAIRELRDCVGSVDAGSAVERPSDAGGDGPVCQRTCEEEDPADHRGLERASDE
jgi:transposase